MTGIEKSIEINATPEKVWPIIKCENVPKWCETVKKVEWTSKEHDNVGATLHMKTEAACAKNDSDVEITEWIDNQKTTWRTTSGFTIIFSVMFTPIKAGTKAAIVVEYELPYSILGKIIDKLRVHKAMEKDCENALKKLKILARNRDI